LTRFAKTDINAALVYERRVRDFHKSLRVFFYPLLFGADEFNAEALDKLPTFSSV